MCDDKLITIIRCVAAALLYKPSVKQTAVECRFPRLGLIVHLFVFSLTSPSYKITCLVQYSRVWFLFLFEIVGVGSTSYFLFIKTFWFDRHLNLFYWVNKIHFFVYLFVLPFTFAWVKINFFSPHSRMSERFFLWHLTMKFSNQPSSSLISTSVLRLI